MIEIKVSKYCVIEQNGMQLEAVPAISGWIKDASKLDVSKLVEAVEKLVAEMMSEMGCTIRPMTEEEARDYKLEEEGEEE